MTDFAKTSWQGLRRLSLCRFLSVLSVVLATMFTASASIDAASAERPALISGTTTNERWAKFCAIQPTVLGMKLAQVQRVLGAGLEQKSRLSYTVEQRPGTTSQPCSIQVTFHIFEGRVESYELSTVFQNQGK